MCKASDCHTQLQLLCCHNLVNILYGFFIPRIFRTITCHFIISGSLSRYVLTYDKTNDSSRGELLSSYHNIGPNLLVSNPTQKFFNQISYLLLYAISIYLYFVVERSSLLCNLHILTIGYTHSEQINGSAFVQPLKYASVKPSSTTSFLPKDKSTIEVLQVAY